MTVSPDAAERKILGDIIALVLDEHAGQSEAALAALKRRAAKNNITGGLLKNLLHELRGVPETPGTTARSGPFATHDATPQGSLRAAMLQRQLTRMTMERDAARLQLSIQLQAAKARRDNRWHDWLLGGTFSIFLLSSALAAYVFVTAPPSGEAHRESEARQSIVSPLPARPAAHETSPADLEASEFRAGWQDRRRLQSWLNARNIDQQAGALFWIDHHDKPGHHSCYTVSGSMSAEWLSGCLTVQKILDQAEYNKTVSTAYQKGWLRDVR